MINQEKVIENRALDPELGIYRLILRGQTAKTARPGQFVHLKVSSTLDPFLRRPISIAGINRQQGEITLFYRVVGRGTSELTRVKENQTLNLIGPLGNGFTVPHEGKLLLLAGGIGIFPLFSLIEALDTSKVKVKLLWGAENRQFLEAAGLKTLLEKNLDYEVSTLDGSIGHKGLITDLLEYYLQGFNNPSEKKSSILAWRAAACGPKAMLQAVTAICRREGIPIEVSLEERMACGVGACLGCVCTAREPSGTLVRKRVCKDGPVFDGGEVVWDEES
ncbi:MAG: dihydroorotate dehydrogenase electron transfer subunit [Peptococcaceae bacterium]|nr:dihydroorotate dehydrogenase electron transfer subunit [Peptococcaceae bacterium]